MRNHLFPRYHVRPPTGYLNDPNGPVVVNGRIHLYFQYRPTTDMASPVLWGHVTSPDLVHWEYQRPALVPHPHGGDRDGCWSGNAVVDDSGRVRVFYSGLVRGEPWQRTLSAVSTDGGYSFGPPGEVVPAPPAHEQIGVLRDPFVWRADTGWWMVLGAGTRSGTAMLRLYHSDDLDTWSYRGRLAAMARTQQPAWDSGAMWECPQILDVHGSLTALIGSWAPDSGIMDVLAFSVGDLAEPVELTPARLQLVDHGPNFYAASATIINPWGPLVWGWATEGRSPEWCRADGWSGMLTLPRIMVRRPDGTLGSLPVPGLSSLRTTQTPLTEALIIEGLGAQLEFDLQGLESSGPPYVLKLCFGPAEFLDISVEPASGRVTVDRTHASSDPRAYGGRFSCDGLDQLRADGHHIRGFVDGSILELFLPDGQVMTTRFYPTTAPPWRFALHGAEGSVTLSVWPLSDSAEGALVIGGVGSPEPRPSA